MITPKIHEEEFAPTYIERFREINSLTKSHFLYFIHHKLPLEQRHRFFHVSQRMAKALDMTHEDFIRLHTIIPVARGINQDDELLPFGDLKALVHTANDGKFGAYIKTCEVCKMEDINRLGYSYSRRNHQLPGFDLCIKHGTPFVSTHTIFRQQVKELESKMTFPIGYDLNNPNIVRYRELVLAIRSRNSPFPASRVRAVIRSRLSFLGYRVIKTGAEPLMSDLIQQTFPERWLNKLLPRMIDKQLGVWHWLDNSILMKCKINMSVGWYVVLSAIFDDTQTCLDLLTSEVALPTKQVNRYEALSKSLIRNHNYINHSWIKARGSYMQIKELLGESQNAVMKWLPMMGLPSLRNFSDSAIEAFIAFHDGHSLENACKAYGVEKEKMEKFLRQATKRPAYLMKLLKNE